ncbi:TolC family outer membrane protein [Tistrella mobilis]|uniref:TolC family type I secretion outer membrane protein n=1 Tax=Tistrella mobilis (strain KA081020-065) TaxID=1110502 RepID=I3TLW1_TISMK|nr:TolC family outer membrane protein [Tistrella mobilis]AFK53749.1 TolC family type I secretion outer membrane protein [Tistrella mobilis KA081020-065]
MRRSVLAAVLAAGTMLATPFVASAESLQDALVSAYAGNPRIDAIRAQLRAVDENIPTALAGRRPQAQIQASAGRAGTSVQNSKTYGTDPRSVTLQITQPVWTGGRVDAQLGQAEAQVLATREQVRAIEQDVLREAASTYGDVFRDRAVVNLNENNVRVLERQLQATRDRFEVGEVTRTDVAQAEARLASARADLTAAQGALASSEATYLRVVGRTPETLEPPRPFPDLPVTRADAIGRARDDNPSVRAARYTVDVAEQQVNSAEATRMPQVSVVGSHQRERDSSYALDRTEDSRIVAQVTVPLYQGGGEFAGIRQAKETRAQRRGELMTAERQAVEGATAAWEQLRSAQASIASLDAAVRAAEIALEGVREEAAVGARTTLDVLDAEQELFIARVNLVRAQRNVIVAGFELAAALGALDIQAISADVPTYDPQDNYRKVRDAWWGTGD